MAREAADGVVQLIDDLLQRAAQARASDVHFEPVEGGLSVRYRVDALLQEVERLPANIGPNAIARLKVLAGLLTYRTDVPQEGSIPADATKGLGDIRVATFPTVRGERAVLRLLAGSQRLLTLDELGHAPETVRLLGEMIVRPQGLLLVCGPAGTGKSTTLYALLRALLGERPHTSIIAVEDPVELRLEGITQVQIESARGMTYPVALRSLLRQDPQVLMIGEIRDAETAKVVTEAALTGHLLLSTVHSGSVAEAIVRLREMGVPAYQLTSVLQGVLAQRLVRRRCTACAEGEAACATCLGTGYAGRSACGHAVALTPALRQAILDGADAAALAAPALCPGSLRDDAQRLVEAGVTTAAEVERVLGT